MSLLRPSSSGDSMDRLDSSYHHNHDPFGRRLDVEDDDSDREDSPPPPHGSFGESPPRGNDPWLHDAPPAPTLGGGVPSSPDGDAEVDDVIVHVAPKGGGHKSRWSHIDDLDSFFKKVYEYHRRHGFAVMMAEEVLALFQVLFIVCLTTFLVEFVDYPVLFREKLPAGQREPLEKVHLSDCVRPFWKTVAHFSLATWACLFVAFLVWCTRALATFYHFFQYWDIKSFYNSALGIEDERLDSVTWHEVQKRLMEAQAEHRMCIHKSGLSELDIYHRILRFKNYLVAMVNKDLLPVRVNVPFAGERVFLSHGLKYNLEFLFFKGPWAPFNQWHLKEEYKQGRKRQELAEQLQSKIALVALVNLLLAPAVFLLQLLYAFFHYAELVKREPGSLGVRRWSQYGRLYLRHFNELDHELSLRLSRAYKPANKYMELFVSPLSVVVAQNVAFVAGAMLAALIALSVWDEDVLNVEHLLFIMTALGAIVAISRVFVPDENLVFCPEKTLTSVLAHIHYFPDQSWRGRAHCPEVMAALGELFPYSFAYAAQELLSPLVTPFVLYFSLRPRAAAVVDFFKNFTVEVQGVGDVCSFAQMDIRRHGDTDWQAPVQQQQQQQSGRDGKDSSAPATPARTNHYTRAEGGKTEMSLVHFSLVNPSWRPKTAESTDFIAALRDQVTRDAEALPTLTEENARENALYSSLHSVGSGSGTGGGGNEAEVSGANALYSDIASSLLQEARHGRAMAAAATITAAASPPPVSESHHDGMAPMPTMADSRALAAAAGGDQHQGASFIRHVQSGLVHHHHNHHMAASHRMMTSSNMSSPLGAGVRDGGASSILPPGAGGASMMLSSRMMLGTLAPPPPPPNLRQDLRRLGLEYAAADMSLSALYLHELHQRSVLVASSRGGGLRNRGGGYESQSRYDFQQHQHHLPRRASLNELDEEENLPLLETGGIGLESGGDGAGMMAASTLR